MKSLEERERELKIREEKLVKKRIRDRISDIMVVIAVLGIVSYNASITKQANEICRQECESIYLGITANPEWLEEIRTNKTLSDALSKLNTDNLTGVIK